MNNNLLTADRAYELSLRTNQKAVAVVGDVLGLFMSQIRIAAETYGRTTCIVEHADIHQRAPDYMGDLEPILVRCKPQLEELGYSVELGAEHVRVTWTTQKPGSM